MRIAPAPGGNLTSSHLRHTTTHGDVTVSWSLTHQTMTVEVTIPDEHHGGSRSAAAPRR